MREPTWAEPPDDEAIARALRVNLSTHDGPSLVDLAVQFEPMIVCEDPEHCQPYGEHHRQQHGTHQRPETEANRG